MKHKPPLLALAGLGLAVSLHAQEAITSAGESAKAGTMLTVSWSIGEVMTETFAQQTFKLTQGVQQPKTAIKVISSSPEIPVGYRISAYPNPANDFIVVAIANEKEAMYPLTLKVFDANSKLLFTKQVTANETNIPVSNLPAGIYLLQLTDKKNNVQTFKIIKQ